MSGIVGWGRVRRLLVLVGMVFVVLPAGSALADVTIGQTGSDGGGCGPNPPGGVDADTNYVVPTGGGAITSFSFQSTSLNDGVQLEFLALRPVSGTTYKVVGKTGLETLAGTGLETFSASIPVQAGDIIGFFYPELLWNCLHDAAGVSGDIGSGGVADPAVNSNVDLPPGFSGKDVNESANVVAAPSIAKAFGAATVPVGGTTSLTFTLTNPSANTSALSGVAFTDTLPSGLVVATLNGLSNSCGGTATATAGTGSVSLTGGSIPANSNCTVVVNVTGTAAGDKNNSTTVSSTNGGTGNTATASLTVVAPPSIAKAFSPNQVQVGGASTLTFTLTNPPANPVAASGVAFTDTLPSGVVVSTPNGLSNSCGGTATATAGTGSISLTGASIAMASSCTVVVNVTASTVGAKVNTSGAVSSTNGGTGNTATATLTVVDSDLALTGVPANVTTNATGPTGAVVHYTPPTATDEGGETPTVGCLPASGSTFAIATTTVTCTATDADDSNSPVTASFTVTVKGATGHFQDLLASVGALPSSTAKSVLSIQVGDALTAAQAGNTSRVCMDLFGVIRTAQTQESYGQLTAAQATSIINAANQIAAVVGCGAATPAPGVLRPAAEPAVKHAAHKRHHGIKTRSKR